MKIKSINTIKHSSYEIFSEQLFEYINNIQKKGEEVEIQYSTTPDDSVSHGIIFSALVIGRINE